MRLLDAVRDASESLEKAGINDHLADAEILSYHTAGIERLAAFLENPEIDKQTLSRIRRLTARRAKGEPVQYITGEVEFCGLRIAVGKGVLIPRPETELLVEEAIKTVRGKGSGVRGKEPDTDGSLKSAGLSTSSLLSPHSSLFSKIPHSSLSFLDLCTGSGCIALALAREFPEAEVTGTDISSKALGFAGKNAPANNIANVTFIKGSLFSPLKKGTSFDLIVSNPPYIRRNEISGLQAEVRDWEPTGALDGGPDGLDFYREILSKAGVFLKPGGSIIFELGYDQEDQVKDLALANGFVNIEIVNDFAGIGRILKAVKNLSGVAG